MSDSTQGQVWDDDEAWEKRQEAYEAHVDALSASLRTCPTHGNPAAIEKGIEGEEYILAGECGCWLSTEYYDTIEQCVAAWNSQPQIDDLAARLRTVEAERDALREERDALQVKLRMKTEAYNLRGDCLDAAQQRIAELEDAPPCVVMSPDRVAALHWAIARLSTGYGDRDDALYYATLREMLAEIGGQGDESADN